MSQRETLVRWALAQVGKPYATYRDCSGFCAAAYRQIGVTIPEGSVAQYGVGQEVRGLIEPGDLIFYDTFGPAPGHVALYVGNGTIVHALNEQRGIVTSEWDAPMGGNDRYMGAHRILLGEDAWTTPTGAASPSAPGVPSGASSSTPARPRRNGEDRTPSGKARRRKHRRREDR